MKNPYIAALLNFVFIGLGYVYAGSRPLVGLVLTLGGGVLLRYEETRIAPAFTGHVHGHWVVLVTGLSLVGVATAVDVFREVKRGGARRV
jgi:hypothetical protein